MNYSSEIYPCQKLIREKYQGEVNVAFLKASLLQLSQDERFSPNFDNIVDFRDSIVKISPSDVMDLMAVHFKVFGLSDGRTAFLVDVPKETALALFFEKKMSLERQIKVFSTLAGAEEWLELSQGNPRLF